MKPIKLEEAKKLEYRDELYHMTNKNANGTPQRWRVNGKVKRWKRDSNRIEVPIKHGLRSFDYLDNSTLHLLSLTEK